MIENVLEAVEAEPPSSPVPDDAACETLLEGATAISHTSGCAHVVIIGHHTLPYMLTLLHQGCASVRSVRPGCPAPDCEAVELAWIVDLESQTELADALRVARSRVGRRGRVVLEGTAFRWRASLADLPKIASAAGLDVVAVDRRMHRLMLAPATEMAMAA
jgi:hypothetical protein